MLIVNPKKKQKTYVQHAAGDWILTCEHVKDPKCLKSVRGFYFYSASTKTSLGFCSCSELLQLKSGEKNGLKIIINKHIVSSKLTPTIGWAIFENTKRSPFFVYLAATQSFQLTQKTCFKSSYPCYCYFWCLMFGTQSSNRKSVHAAKKNCPPNSQPWTWIWNVLYFNPKATGS